MNFQPHLAQAVVLGLKTVTRRKVSDNPRSPWARAGCKLQVGRSYAVCPGRGKPQVCRVVVTGVALEPLGHLTRSQAQREGFESSGAFEAAWREINGAYDPQSLVWVVRFRRPEHAGAAW